MCSLGYCLGLQICRVLFSEGTFSVVMVGDCLHGGRMNLVQGVRFKDSKLTLKVLRAMENHGSLRYSMSPLLQSVIFFISSKQRGNIVEVNILLKCRFKEPLKWL